MVCLCLSSKAETPRVKREPFATHSGTNYTTIDPKQQRQLDVSFCQCRLEIVTLFEMSVCKLTIICIIPLGPPVMG